MLAGRKREQERFNLHSLDKLLGYKAGASKQESDAEFIKLEKVTELPSEALRIDKSEFFGHNCYKLSCQRQFHEKATKDLVG